jgi:antitoxin ParD1/3/4
MNISLPETLKEFVDEQVVERGCGTSGRYVRELIRKEQDRQHLRGLLLSGASSGIGEVADEAYFEALRHRVRSAKFLNKISSSPQATARLEGQLPLAPSLPATRWY